MASHVQEESVIVAVQPSFGHGLSLLLVNLTRQGGQIHGGEVFALQKPVEAVLCAEGSLLLLSKADTTLGTAQHHLNYQCTLTFS